MLLLSLFACTGNAYAQNTDILWQKTLTKNTIPISSIAIAEGKYVAALKGDEIVILDYNTGDSIKVFPKPRNMLLNDIVLGKNGERLYVHIVSDFYGGCHLESWDITTGEKLKDINMESKSTANGSNGTYGYFTKFSIASSLDGKYIVVGSTLETTYGAAYTGNGSTKILNTEDNTLSFQDYPYPTTYSFGGEEKDPQGSGILSLYFSPSGNYLLRNAGSYFVTKKGHGDLRSADKEGCFISLSPLLSSFKYSKTIPRYIVSSGDDFLLSGNNLTDLPPVHFFRSLTKTGFVFLPDDNHMLAFNAGGGVAAISNIEKDTWEKVYHGDSLTENIIQINAARTAFVTATNNRITLWKIPDTLQAATLTADFTMSRNATLIKDSIQIFDTITFANKTFPFKRGSSFEWNFGDGSEVSKDAHPIHKFSQDGTFIITLNVWDTLGRTGTVAKKVVVSFPTPKAGFTTPKDTFFVGNFVNFSNTTTPIRNGTICTWNFGDGSISNELNPIHRFFQPGNFTVILLVRDTLGRSDSINKTIVCIKQIVPSGALWVQRFHSQSVNSLVFSPDGQSIISGGSDSYSRVWETTSGKQLFSKNFGQPVYSVAFTKDSKSGIVGSYQISNNSPVYVKYSIAKYYNYMHIWHFPFDSLELKINWNVGLGNITVIPEFQYAGLQNSSLSSSLSENQDWFIVGADGTASSNINTINSSLIFLNFGNILLYNFSTNISRYYNLYRTSGTPTGNPLYASTSSSFVLISPDNISYITLRYDNYSKTENIIVKHIINDSTIRIIPFTASSMHFSPDKYHLLTNTGLWDIYDSILVKPVELPSIFEYHPDGIHVFTLRSDSTIGIYNLNANSYEYLYPKQPTIFTALAVSPDGKHIATGDKYGYITVWNVPDTLKTSIKADFNTTLLNRTNLKTTDTVAFANTTLPANNKYDFLWNFNDGTTSSERNPKHIFIKAGTYTVTLTAMQNGEAIDSMTKQSYITITESLATDEPKAALEPRFNIIPNPSYGETTLSYTLSQPANIQIKITDVLGREISSWSLQEQEGEHSILWNSTSAAVGMYYCTFSVDGMVHTIPIVVMQ